MLYLSESAKQDVQSISFVLNERLPRFILGPCTLEVTYQVAAQDDVYLINMRVGGHLHVTCQRCMEDFSLPYDNQTVIAVCPNDSRAEELLEHYECVVSENGMVDLEALVIDELHLYAPSFHPEKKHCGGDINQYLIEENES